MGDDFSVHTSFVMDRREKFEEFLSKYTINLEEYSWRFSCPSCGYPTLYERNAYEICVLCGWEDDGQDDKTTDEVWGGPNGHLSLTESQVLFEYNKNTDWEDDEGEEQFVRTRKIIIQLFDALLVTEKDYEIKKTISKINEAKKEYHVLLSKYLDERTKRLSTEERPIMELFKKSDNSKQFDQPDDFEYEILEKDINVFIEAFKREFNESIYMQDSSGYQDSSVYTEIYLPQSSLLIPAIHKNNKGIFPRGVITFSTFSKMVTIHMEDDLKATVFKKIKNMLKNTRFNYIPYVFTNVEYPDDGPHTWGDRFFNWI